MVARLGGDTADELTSRTTMLVIGADGFAPGSPPPREAAEKSNKLRRAEEANARSPGRVRILTEEDFCSLGGLRSPESLRQQFHALRDIRSRYPAARDDYLRYLEKWGLIRAAVRTNGDAYYGFRDVAVIKQASAEIASGVPFRAVVRALLAAREGQLTLDFQPPRGDGHPAKVLEMAARAGAPTGARRGAETGGLRDPQRALAASYFNEGAALDEGNAEQQGQAMEAYRQALLLDPDLVPALVNLANLHYARSELVEAQALYERSLGLDPECFEAHFNLGNIHHDLSRFDEALVCYSSALSLRGDYPDGHFYLAVTLEKMGRSAAAKPHWRAYQNLAPDGEWIDLAREFSE